MGKKKHFYPGFKDENLGSDKRMDDLAFNEDDNSSEIDVPTQEEFYDHPNPYKTSVKNGGDMNSDFDEANLEALDQYQDDDDYDDPYDEYGMRYADDSIIEVDPVDESLAETPEDQRDDLDEEGYPLNDSDRPLT